MAGAAEIHFRKIGTGQGIPVVFAHGWGRDHRDFIPVAEAISPVATSFLLDLPGFGDSPRPEAAWGTRDYAHALHDFLLPRVGPRMIWVGHSFGGRIGLRMAHAFPDMIAHMVLVASAGIPTPKARTPQTMIKTLRGKYRSAQFKRLVRDANEAERIALEKDYGSPDYVQSRALGLRDIFLATIREDQSANLPHIKVPTTCIYGENDGETPPAAGRRIAQLLRHGRYVQCPGLDHISVLDRGRHQIATAVKEALFADTQTEAAQ